ncbi:MAG: bifunctional precorrin-2 dehydrogenase/sirohydrochlorin ferrochelatase [Magnetococcales bacterium]|nr:bifunctional precorrin-2 dehydrogenase/sirohydrochlorin ferrochelatase [Magnetococcales bacterium]
MPHYLAELVLEGRETLVVGGGRVARRKIEGLLATGARVTVLAPTLDPVVAHWVEAGRVAHWSGVFSAEVLAQRPKFLLVFAATDRADLNREVARLCGAEGILCNSADDPASSGFLVPAVVRRGEVVVAIGTGGRSPALSRVLKERIDDWLEPGWAALAEVFGAWRERVVEVIPQAAARQSFWRVTAIRAACAGEEGALDGKDADAWFRQRLQERE